ncbi:mitochondrial 2-oxoglutarate dehydrogenase E1 form 2 [Andalucia godoyi]|uniref:Mitochondrial 2-oxoglutarate dehydrogenase E1 form 2 n=1 Tax=Andalucia godoyi TaxID=505711 RepID=A0A8K0AJR7_ANDGO|nr:mitochondrial 2-oxoglutarate dehydrogenase E1 form 2 [Andalucia godoyi]|eukprot:ANDGO_03025.mRNA.1 mitochondrial 2-oxoglutarate dehydrogenase E1 form 2
MLRAARYFSSATGGSPNVTARLVAMSDAFRRNGHLRADLDPLKRWSPSVRGVPAAQSVSFDISHYGLSGTEPVDSSVHPFAKSAAELLDVLKKSYCGTLTVQAQHLANPAEREWFVTRLETTARQKTSPALRSLLLESIAQCEAVDHYLAKKFPGVKRYGCEGAEAMMPALEFLFDVAARQYGVQDIVLGMPHRGRINLLLNSFQYPAAKLFAKLLKGYSESGLTLESGTGDVISHLAASYDHKSGAHISMIHNPSHLETADAVAVGKARAKMDRDSKALCLVLHGDAAYAGQGIVAECFQMMNLPSFSVKGVIHMIVNNQLGFTTENAIARSTPHAADVAKFAEVPIIHVNADDPEAVVSAMRLALEYKFTFDKDVVLDLIGYRRHGHNELDEPAFTQPQMYSKIRAQPSVVSQYAEKLHGSKEKAVEYVKSVQESVFQRLDDAYNQATSLSEQELLSKYPYDALAKGSQWENVRSPSYDSPSKPIITGLSSIKEVADVIRASVSLPSSDFTPHERLLRTHIQARLKRLEQDKLDWATAEALAFGSLVGQGFRVRITGQDVERGTFSHRHLVLYDVNNGKAHHPFGKENVMLCNSFLSEEAVLGFEFGYAAEHPSNLVIWEAQFGDFVNTAQVPVDTFVTSSIQKWRRQSSLVLSLPHGFDGTGPEHSSCRVERWLQLASVDADPFDVSISVVQPSTPAQIFHMLRRQMLRDCRIPLVMVGPKTLLRLPEAVSSASEMGPGTFFQTVIDDSTVDNPSAVKAVVFCSGKVYYDLLNQRSILGKKDSVALVRIEELHPFPVDKVREVLGKYKSAKKIVWYQEEPRNQGAWTHARDFLQEKCSVHKVEYVGRRGLSLPAVGADKFHKAEVQQLQRDFAAAIDI